ncbi:sulfotransferase [Candidatus Kuenenia sp.]|uniref:sulfotransferase n=1 Tax=Candidatus Kuenenia sp. TaxID=2499824 RepID=UPI00321FE759
MKTVCFVINQHDANWLAEYWNNHIGKEEISVVAPSFEGRITAQSLNIPYKSYEEYAWAIDKAKIFDHARWQAYYWHQLPELKSNPHLEAVRAFKGYPLLVMHHPTFFQAFQEIFQSYEFITKIIQKESPDRIVTGRYENPFDNEAQPPFNSIMLNILTSSYGLEHEVIKALALSRNIEVIVKAVPSNAWNTAASTVAVDSMSLPKEIACTSKLAGPKILFFTWGGYYFQQVSETFDYLLKNSSRIGVVIVGGKLIPDEEGSLERKNIYVTYKSDWHTKNEDELLLEWKRKGERAFESISQNRALNDYFSETCDSCCTGLAMEAVKANLTKYIPYTVRELIRSENIIETFKSDVVIAHFAWHPWESADVLPARQYGIPTLTIGHGVSASMIAPIDTFSSEYYAVNGIAYKEALMKSQGCSDASIALVGNCRFDKIKVTNSNMKEIKKAFGLNPESPVCIFCDSSGWSHAFEKRHSVFKTIEQILALKNIFPELQIVYRIHHGLSSGNFMKRIFDNTKIPGFIFQISPSPLFTDIVQAADFVIAHHTSAIAEALLSGVRVIYLTALSSIIELDHYCCDAVKIADNFEILPNIINKFLNNPVSKEDVRVMAQPYFEKLLNGCDGKSNNRLSRLILKLTEIPENQREKGFCDWIKRIEASCEFKIGQTNSIQPNKGDSKVSKSNDITNVVTKKTKTKGDYTGHNLVFIVGCPRSGTTWLQRLLACHPKIRSGQESDVFDMFIGPQLRAWRYCLDYKQSGRPVGLSSYLRESEYLSALRQYMMNLLEPMIGNLQEGEVFVEKTPSHALFIPEIMEMLPECKIIHVLRDVRDVVASLLAASKSWGQYWAPKDAHSAATMWVQHVQAVRDSTKKLSSTQFYELRYEDFVNDTENILIDVSSFLNLQWPSESLRIAISDNRVEKAKKDGGTPIPIRGELGSLLGPVTKEPEGFVRKGQPGSWKDELSSQDLHAISRIAQATMLHVGYNWETGKDSEAEIKDNWYTNRQKEDLHCSHEINIDAMKIYIDKLREEGKVSLAETALDASLNKYPDSLELRLLKAEFKAHIGKQNEAENILLEIIKIKPDHIGALNKLAVIEYSEGHLMSSLEFIKHVLTLEKSNQEALKMISKIKDTYSQTNVH